MSISYVFTVVGAYNYDRTIFDGLELPNESFIKDYNLVKNFVPMDKETFINNLLIQCGQLSLPFTDIEFLKNSIAVWSRMHKLDWQQRYETIFYAYNPIWNKDGEITETEERTTTGESSDTASSQRTGTDTRVKTVDDDTSRDKTDTETGTVTNDGTESTDTVNYVNAFDSGTDVKHDKTERDTATENTETFNKSYVTDEDISRDIEENETLTKSETITDTKSGDKSESTSFTNTRTERGNIGVTTTQKMIQDQRDIIFNMYQYIIDSFKENFCLLIW